MQDEEELTLRTPEKKWSGNQHGSQFDREIAT